MPWRCCLGRQRRDEKHQGQHAHGGREAVRPDEGDERNTEGDVVGKGRRRDQGEQPGTHRGHAQGCWQHTQLRPGLVTACQDKCRCDHEAEHDVEPEDRPPVCNCENGRTEQRPEDAAELLYGADHAQRRSAPFDRPEVGNERQRRRHQPAAADALQHPAAHQHRQLDRDRGDSRADHEQGQAEEQDPLARNEIREPADQRQHRDVAEQEARDDRRCSLQLIDTEADAGHHVRQSHDHDVGVRRSEGHRDRRGREQRPRAC